ncbi:hypothetical protein FACS189487_03640 [Campylobacterota bacterium]|nr:hypothetical protein FACS189487_03640 [Campylobacterota bacterium]
MLKYDAVVIGGGLSGMTSALLLSARGKKTALIESGATLSPLMHGFDRRGVHFETGFHYGSYLGSGEVGRYIFDQLGLELEAARLPAEYDEVRLPTGRIVRLAYERKSLESNLIAEFPDEKEAIIAYLNAVSEAIKKSAFLNMHDTQNSGLNNAIDVLPTLQEVLDKYFRSEELKAVLSVTSVLHGTPPDKISFALHCCAAGSLYESAWAIKGGGLAINRAFQAALEKNGVDIFLNSKALNIEEHNLQLKRIVCTDDKVFDCEICVSSIHPKRFLDIAPESVYRGAAKARLRKLEETPGFFSIYGIQKRSAAAKSNVFSLSDLNINAMFNPRDISDTYFMNFGGGMPQPICAIAFSPLELWIRDTDYKEKKRYYQAKLVRAIEKAMPELIDGAEFVAASTPATQLSYTGYMGGYALQHDVRQTKITPMTKIKGLFITGQSVVLSGLLGAIISSLLTDRAIGREYE